MAQDVTGISVELRGDKAITDARRLDSELNRLGRTGTKTEGSFERLSRKSISTGSGFDGLRRKSFSLQSAFRGLSGVAAGLGVILTFKELTSTITQFEKFSGALKTATGSAFDANRAFGEIEKFAANTPFALEQSIDAFIKLKNLGLDPSMEALRSYGNTSAALGKDLNQMIEAVADAATGEFERLKELGIRAKNQGDTIRFTFQGISTEVGNNARDIEDYLRQIGDVNFAGAMEEQMERLPGLFSNLGDSVNRLFREMGEAGVTDILATGLRQAISVVNSLADSVDTASVTLQANFEMWKTSIDNTLLKFGTSIDEVSPKIAQLGGGFIEFASIAATAISNIPPVVEAAVQVIQADFNIARAVLIAGWMKIEQGATLAWENIAFAAASAWENIKSSFFSALSEMGNKLATFSELAVRALPVLPGFDLALRPAVSAAAEALRGLSESSDTAQSTLSQLEAQHRKNVAAIHGQINAINDAKDATVSAAQAEISAAREGLQASLNAREKRIDSLMRENASMELLDDRAAAVLKTMEKNTKATSENATSSAEAAKAAKKHAAEQKRLNDELTSAVESLDPLVRAANDYNRTVKTLSSDLAKAELGQDRVNELLAKAKGEFLETAENIDKATDASQRLVDDGINPMEEAFKRTFERIDNVAADFWRNLFEGGKASLDGLKNLAIQTAAEIAHSLTTRRLTAGVAGFAASGSAMAGGRDFGFNPMATNFLGGPAFGPERISAMGLPTGISDVLASSSFATNPLTSGIGGFAGNFGANALLGGDRGMGANIGGTIGAIGGSFLPLPPGVGTAVGAFVGNALGGLLGSSDFKASLGTAIDRSSPALAGTASDVIRQSSFGNVGFGQSKDFASRDAQAFIDSIVAIDDAIAAIAPDKINEISAALDGFVGTVRKGMGNEGQIRERLDVIFTAIDESLAGLAQSGDIQTIIEDIGGFRQALSALQQAANPAQAIGPFEASLRQLEAVLDAGSDAAGRLGLSVNELQASFDSASTQLTGRFNQDIQQAILAIQDPLAAELEALDQRAQALRREAQAVNGNIDAVNILIELEKGLIQSRYAVAEATESAIVVDQSAIEIARTREQLERQILQLEGNTIELRRLELAALDESLRPLQERIFALQDSAIAERDAARAQEDLLRNLNSARSDLVRLLGSEASELERTKNQFEGFARSLRDFRQGLLTGPLSPLGPEQQLSQARRQFEQIAKRAQLGDVEAIGQLEGVSQTFLNASRDFFASNEGFVRDFERVQSILDSTETVAERQANIADHQLSALNSQIDILNEIAGGVQSLEDAIRAFAAAEKAAVAGGALDPSKAVSRSTFGNANAVRAQAEAILKPAEQLASSDFIQSAFQKVLGRAAEQSAIDFFSKKSERQAAQIIFGSQEASDIRGFASGGIASGLALVGEQGPELVRFNSPSRVHSNADSRKLVDNTEVVRELKESNKNQAAQIRVMQVGLQRLIILSEQQSRELADMRASGRRKSAA